MTDQTRTNETTKSDPLDILSRVPDGWAVHLSRTLHGRWICEIGLYLAAGLTPQQAIENVWAKYQEAES